MGLLDEAIKQHLELKRARGADPSEIARQEHEALDPPGYETEPDPDATVAHELPIAAEPEPARAPAPVAEQPAPTAYEPPPEAPAPPPVAEPVLDLSAEPHHEAQPVADEPPDEGFDMEPAPPVESAAMHQPTAEYALEDLEALRSEPQPEPQHEPAAPEPDDDEVLSAAEGDADVADEDVLEETPEFLQETPEHDRLWFEQKPPRDFDF